MAAALIIIALVAFFIAYIALWMHRKSEVFEGVVVNKDIRENTVQSTNPNQSSGFSFGRSAGVTHEYVVMVQTSDGKTKTWQVTEGKYEIIKIGDRVSKSKGTTDLQVVSSSPAAPASETPGQPPAAIVN